MTESAEQDIDSDSSSESAAIESAARWRGSPAKGGQPTARRWIPRILSILLVAGVGSITGLVSFVKTVPKPHFIGVWAPTAVSLETGLHGPLVNDQLAITSANLFPDVDQALLENPRRQRILEQLALLQESEKSVPVIVYLSAFASIDESGNAFLLPQGANAAELNDRIYLSQLLGLLKKSTTEQKLLVLDICWPFAIPDQKMFSDDVATQVEREINAVADPNLLCISSCSPGQVAWTMMAPRRSVFGYFFEKGVAGGADGFGQRANGRVSVVELATYLTSHVDEYSAFASPSRQTPMLLGAGKDFEIAACPIIDSGSGRSSELGTKARVELTLPEWLRLAWQVRDDAIAADSWKIDPQFLRQLESQILLAEMSWARGEAESKLALRLEVELESLITDFNKLAISLSDSARDDLRFRTIDIPKLSVIVQRSKEHEESKVAQKETKEQTQTPKLDKQATVEPSPLPVNAELCPMQIASLFKTLKTKQKITPAAQWPAVEAKLLDEYAGQNSDISDAALSRGLFRFALQSSELNQSQLMALAKIWRRRSSEPVDLRSAILLTLADQFDSGLPSRPVALAAMIQIQHALRLIDESEKPFERFETWGWLGDLRSAADDQRYIVESLFWNPAYTDADFLSQRIQQTMEQYRTTFGLAHRIESTLDTLDLAMWRLPSFTRLTRSNGQNSSHWRLATDQAVNLAAALKPRDAAADQMVSSQIELSKRIETAASDAAGLQALLDQLFRPLSKSHLQAMTKDDADVSISNVQIEQMENILATPLIDASVRVKLYEALGNRAKLLHEQAVSRYAPGRLDPRTALSRQDRIRTVGESEARASHRKTISNSIVRIDQMSNSAKADTQSQALGCAKLYWAHQANLYGKLALHSPIAAFYEGLAQRYRSSTGESVAPAIRLETASVDRVLSFSHPESTIDVAAAIIQQRPSLKSENQRFRLASARLSAAQNRKPPVFANVLPTSVDGLVAKANWHQQRSELALDMSILPGADQQQLSTVGGFFVELGADGQRFLHRVDLPGLANSCPVDIFLGRSSDGADRVESEIRLRPSVTPQPRFLFVKNLTEREQEINVSVNELVVHYKMHPRQVRQVILPGKPPKPGTALPVLSDKLDVTVADATTEGIIVQKDFDIVVASPREYVELVRAMFVPFEGGKNRLEVTLRACREIVGPDCIVELKLSSSEIPGLRSVEGGKFRATIPRDGTPVTLYAENLRLDEVIDEEGRFEISVDGAPRTFVLRNVFARQGNPTTPTLVSTPQIGIVASQKGLAGPGYRVVLQPINAAVDSSLSLSLGKSGSNSQPDREYRFPSPFQTKIGFATDDQGRLLFTAGIDDWKVDIDTTGLVGERHLVCESVLDRVVKDREELPIALDNSPPHTVRFQSLPTRLAGGSMQAFSISAYSELTGIETVKLFVGRPEENQIPQKAAVVECRSNDARRVNWRTTMKIPKNPSEIQITAAATNGAGLTTFETRTVEIVKAADLNKGSIAGQVFESVRVQPGLEVLLFDQQGQSVAKTKTRFDGRFVFNSVPAGSYFVQSNKPASGRSGRTGTKVRAGQTASADISLGL